MENNKAMGELRVYVADRQGAILGKEEFITLAEEQGGVYSLTGFLKVLEVSGLVLQNAEIRAYKI